MIDIEASWLGGKRIVNEIVMALEYVDKTYDEAILRHENVTVDLPLRRVTPKDYEEADEALKKFAAKVKDHVNFDDNAGMHIHTGTILRWDEQHKQDIYHVEVHIARLGNIAIATNPFELFFGLWKQDKSKKSHKADSFNSVCLRK